MMNKLEKRNLRSYFLQKIFFFVKNPIDLEKGVKPVDGLL